MTEAPRTVVIAADHAGFELKEHMKAALPEIQWVDLGPANADRVDYPDFAEKAARAVAKGEPAEGLLICGTGIGMCIAANKIRGIRAAHAESEAAARLAKQHNDANMLCIGARLTAPEYAVSIVRAWLSAKFEGGRHGDRIGKITKLEQNA